ncbi:MAG: hypothetical protein KDC66_02660, partial [Phaeodactylibacter sp.]|nr:hypothetical protein [Phaeodactylibacter sp.]
EKSSIYFVKITDFSGKITEVEQIDGIFWHVFSKEKQKAPLGGPLPMRKKKRKRMLVVVVQLGGRSAFLVWLAWGLFPPGPGTAYCRTRLKAELIQVGKGGLRRKSENTASVGLGLTGKTSELFHGTLVLVYNYL